NLFFRSYTEKVWGIPCGKIGADWGRQRIKGLSILNAVRHMARKLFSRSGGVRQKGVETSLIEQFLYPKLGPGPMWDEVALIVPQRGGESVQHQNVVKIHTDGSRVRSSVAVDQQTQEQHEYTADFFFSTMAIKDLVKAAEPTPPPVVVEVADGLVYRDFI